METPQSPTNTNITQAETIARSGAASGALGPIERYLLWILLSALTTGALAWIAVELQTRRIAPAILFPVLIGIALAAALEGVSRLVDVRPGRRWLVAVAV